MARHLTKRQARDLFRAAKLNEQQMYPAAQRHHDEHGSPPARCPDGTEVWIERKHQKTRFLDCHGNQVGPVHANLAPAVVWARVQGWRDPSLPNWFNDGAIAELRGGGVPVTEG